MLSKEDFTFFFSDSSIEMQPIPQTTQSIDTTMQQKEWCLSECIQPKIFVYLSKFQEMFLNIFCMG